MIKILLLILGIILLISAFYLWFGKIKQNEKTIIDKKILVPKESLTHTFDIEAAFAKFKQKKKELKNEKTKS